MATTERSKETSNESATGLDKDDRELIRAAKRALEVAVDLKHWWEGVDANDAYTDRYDETFVFRRPADRSFGFFEDAQLKKGKQAVIGNVQRMRYDRAKSGTSAAEMNKQVREFVLRYFMRVSDFRQPQPVPEPDQAELPDLLSYFDRRPNDDYKTSGFGYSQLFYRLKKNGEEGAFPAEQPRKHAGVVLPPEDAIIDLSRLAKEFEWVVLKNPIEDFGFDFKPLGENGPQLKIPIKAANHLVMSHDTVTIDPDPGDGLLGRYGIGYGFIKDPGKTPLLAYGPGQLEPALETITWEVTEEGDVFVKMVFVSRAPEKLLNLSLNPLQWGFTFTDLVVPDASDGVLKPLKKLVDSLPFSNVVVDPVLPSVNLLNALTGDAAEKYFGISERDLNKEMLYLHFLKHYDAVLGSLQTWRQYRDWTKPDQLPDWVRTGVSA